MSRPRQAGALIALALAGCGAGPMARAHHSGAVRPSVPPVPPARQELVVGQSVRGRAIRAVVVGPLSAARRVLVVGCVHGDETAGVAVTRALRSTVPPMGTSLWVIDTVNPDGCAAHTRQNAHGVDLNRNSPWHWRALDAPGGTVYSGPHALSEPESRAIVALVRRVRPSISIWYHQHAALVDDSGGDPAIERRYARLVGLPFRHFGTEPGSITSWQDATFRGDTAFVVELPAGALPPRAVARHSGAVLALARGLALR